MRNKLIEEKWYKSYTNIVKGIENAGYCEWRKSVDDDINKLSDVCLRNASKRCEIKMKKVDSETYHEKIVGVISICIPVAVMISTSNATVYNWLVSIMASTIGVAPDTEKAILETTSFISDVQISLLGFTCQIAMWILMFYMTAIIADSCLIKKRIRRCTYYEEIQIVIKAEMDRREKNKL